MSSKYIPYEDAMNRVSALLAFSRSSKISLLIDGKELPVQLTQISNHPYNGINFEGHVSISRELQLSSRATIRPSIKNVIFNPPATIVFWTDGTKTVVKCQDGDEFDPEKGIAMAYVKKANGDKGNYNEIFKPWVEEYYKKQWEEWQNEINFTEQIKRGILTLNDATFRISKIVSDININQIVKPETNPIQPSCYDDEKYERALKYFETNMGEGPCDIPYCEVCGAQLVAIEAIRRCLVKDKKEKENA